MKLTEDPEYDELMRISAERTNQFERICDDCRELFIEKNMQYRDAIKYGGVIGAVNNLGGIIPRLWGLVFHTDDLGVSASGLIRSILMDCVNYAIIGLMMIQDQNWRGKL